jgi:transposase
MKYPTKVGIDQSKKWFDACLLEGDKKPRKKKFLNTEEGFELFAKWLEELKVQKVHVSMESTGRYGNKLAAICCSHGHSVSMVNPRRVSNHRISMGIRNKTDSNDMRD